MPRFAFILLLFILTWLILALTSCTLTVAPDGTRQWTVDGVQAARGILILSEK